MDKTDHDLNTFFALIFHEISLSVLFLMKFLVAEDFFSLYFIYDERNF